MKPIVSVLTTAYNRERYIADCIESVLASEFEDFELLIVDDCSVDNTYEISKRYEKRDSRVRVLRSNMNLGDYSNRNYAASFAQGKYLKYLDSDDIMYPHCLGVMVSCMEQFPEAGFGLSAHNYRDRPHPVLLKSLEAYRSNFFSVELFGRAPGSSIIKKSQFDLVKGFTGKDQVGDHELWLMLAQKNSMVTMPSCLVWDRVHGDQEQFHDSNVDKMVLHHLVQVEALNADDCPLSEMERQQAVRKLYLQRCKELWLLAFRDLKLVDAVSLKGKLGVSIFDLIRAMLVVLQSKIRATSTKGNSQADGG
jgi:glycosyltransferase involved in cell wall biosynthesis